MPGQNDNRRRLEKLNSTAFSIEWMFSQSWKKVETDSLNEISRVH